MLSPTEDKLASRKRGLEDALFTGRSTKGDDGAPLPDDVHQGDAGNCYFCASLNLLAKYDPEAITSAIVKSKGVFEVSFRYARWKPGTGSTS